MDQNWSIYFSSHVEHLFEYNSNKGDDAMAIRDRGKIKWAPASFMPEGFAMTRKMFKDQLRQVKPIIDDYEKEEFDRRIGYAMEFHFPVKLTTWSDRFTEIKTGKIHYIDPITNLLRIELQPGEFERVTFNSVVGVNVVD
jgi:hypothetical protein